MRICGGGVDGHSSIDCGDTSFSGMFDEGVKVECDDEEKRKSVIEPTFAETHETVVGDVRPF